MMEGVSGHTLTTEAITEAVIFRKVESRSLNDILADKAKLPRTIRAKAIFRKELG
jgi:hypothetical protein